MSNWKLHFSMIGTLAVIFGLSTLVFTVVLTLMDISLSLTTIVVFVIVFSFAQWMLSPYLVGAVYKVKELGAKENSEMYNVIEQLSIKSKISPPKLMLAQSSMPNAFAYGSPLTGNRVAITQGLLDTLDKGEIEAVIAHELGHLKHRDVQVMMTVSFLPTLFYFIGYSLMLSGMFGGGRGKSSGGGGNNALIGIAFTVFSWVLSIFTLYLSRLREYYADRHSVSIVENGAEKLSTGLVTIVNENKNQRRYRRASNRGNQKENNTSFKALFISDPDKAEAEAKKFYADNDSNNNTSTASNKQELLREALAKKVTGAEKFAELFATHPNIIKRLKAIQTQA
ncbi:MAG: M48 family metalloprotease [Nitrososphaerota archaeon]|jgi:heat shock protein HtpX|nr:M48 family metalloprotease [Nitrososphaerota archaeon]